MSGLKRCSRCGELKPASTEYFLSNKQAKSGLSGACRVCHNASSNLWHKRNPDYQREWHQNNVEKMREYRSKWQKANPENGRKTAHRWYHANIVKARKIGRFHSSNRRAQKRKNGGTHTPADIETQYNSQKGKCWWCGKKIKDAYHVDHRVPLSRGGSNAPENLVIACPKCNQSKSDKLPHEWSDRLL